MIHDGDEYEELGISFGCKQEFNNQLQKLFVNWGNIGDEETKRLVDFFIRKQEFFLLLFGIGSQESKNQLI